MEVERQRIQEDLRGQIAGDVYCDDLYVQLYASDASIYEISPLGVVSTPERGTMWWRPLSMRRLTEIPLHARGSGSGLAGGALGRGLVVDFSRYLRKVLRWMKKRCVWKLVSCSTISIVIWPAEEDTLDPIPPPNR